ncbi:MAG: ATP-grasp fold amidoligase family protein [Petrimonas sp.]|nr:ATP-grasp fold amidoligase family protein [Petrimonas sp.]MEA5080298.1 ATP-grasp fold amidoligase family protein [Dysgonamonadaceae bacterium]
MHIKHNKYFKVLLFPFIYFAELYGDKHPKSYMKIRYLARFRKCINLKEPKNLNEKIQWILYNTDTTLWTSLADKYKVREYVKERGYENTLVELYGKWDKPDEIDFTKLPESFVLKTNNSCGTVLIINDKAKIEEATIKKQLTKWLNQKRNMGAEIHYKNIKPCIIAEKLLPKEKGQKTMIDYKIWCFNGKPYTILTTSNRFKSGVHIGNYDLDWNYHPENLITSSTHPLEHKPLIKPKKFKEMLGIAESLSQPFPQVRVDLYNINGQIYFGEMTFTALGGLMNYFTEDFLLEMGNHVDVHYKTKMKNK